MANHAQPCYIQPVPLQWLLTAIRYSLQGELVIPAALLKVTLGDICVTHLGLQNIFTCIYALSLTARLRYKIWALDNEGG